MQVSSAKLKYKSAVNLFFALFFALFQIVILLLLSSKIYTTNVKGFKFGLILAVIDAIVFIPMFFKLGYEIRSDHLYICDWPFGVYKIPYADIISVDGEMPQNQKHLKKVGLSANRFPIRYVRHKKGEEEITTILISPADKDNFLLFLEAKCKEFPHEVTPAEQAAPTEEKTAKVPDKAKTEKSEQKTDISLKAPSKTKPKPEKTPLIKKEVKLPKKIKSKKETPQTNEEIIIPKQKEASYFTIEEEEKKPR